LNHSGRIGRTRGCASRDEVVHSHAGHFVRSPLRRFDAKPLQRLLCGVLEPEDLPGVDVCPPSPQRYRPGPLGEHREIDSLGHVRQLSLTQAIAPAESGEVLRGQVAPAPRLSRSAVNPGDPEGVVRHPAALRWQ
jgi:hypothetical protein